MATPLLETKLFVPRARPGLVPRPRLNERLNAGAQSRLTLVSAPVGFGKTTLLAEWLAAAPAEEPCTFGTGGRSVAWLSLDQSDNHATSFWTYLITALQRVERGVGASAISLLQSPQPPPIEAVLTLLLNELSAMTTDVMLVLDDYHVLDASDIHDGMVFLLEHLPPRLHLVVASRADPALPLARLRARGELVEIRAADLRFTPDEAAAYLNEIMGLHLTAEDVAALESRTEGWIAALQLAALSMQGRDDLTGFIAGFSGDDRYIVDYLVEEVLQRQPEGVRNFLLQTSILDRLSAPLCNAVTGQDSGSEKTMLEALERGNLFVVPLDDQRRWYRYHHLFADVLHARLLGEQPDHVPDLHRRASAWYERNGEPSEAIRHALAAEDFPKAADLVELAVPALRRNRQEATLLGWLAALPDDLLRCRPVLSNVYAGELLAGGELEGVDARLQDAERWLDPLREPGGSLREPQGAPVLRGTADMHVGMSNIHFERNDLHVATQHLLRSQELGEHNGLPQNPYRWRVAMARIQEAQGDLDGALDLLHDPERLYVSDFFPNVRPVSALKARAWVAQGRLAEAFDWAREQGLSVEDDLSYLREFEHITLARALLARRSILEALALLERLVRAADEGGRTGSVIEILTLQALAHQTHADLPATLAPLERALSLAEPENYVRVFVDEGPPMAVLLEEAAKHGIAPNYVHQLLAASPRADDTTPRKQISSEIESLSERELEVLRLLGTDMDGRE